MLEIVAALDRVTSIQEWGDLMFDVFGSAGVEHIFAGALPPRDASAPVWDGASGFDKPRDITVMAYDSRGHHFFRDGQGAATQHVEYRGLAPSFRQAAKLASLVCPIAQVGDSAIGLSFYGERLCNHAMMTRAPFFVASYAFARLLRIDAAHRPTLNQRQIAVLQWAAEGKTDKEIGAILDVSQHTVDKYMRQCLEILNAVNRTAAIVLALRQGLIR